MLRQTLKVFNKDRYITCELTGEMDDGTLVWTEVGEDGELILDNQYYEEFCTNVFTKENKVWVKF